MTDPHAGRSGVSSPSHPQQESSDGSFADPGYGDPAWSNPANWAGNNQRGDASTTTTLPPVAGGNANPFDAPGNARPQGQAGGPQAVAAPGAPAATGKARTAAKARRPRGDNAPRRARLTLRHLNPWTVLKFSCVLAVALFFVWLIVVGILYGLLDAAGVFDKINSTVKTINGAADAQDVVTPSIVFGGAAVIGAVNIVLFIALSTLGSLIYNLCADLVGGIEVTLSERE